MRRRPAVLNRLVLLPLCFGFALSTAQPLVAASTVRQPDKTVASALRSLAANAGVIFIGTVGAVRRSDLPGSDGIVEVDFSVERGIRGCTSGSVYTLREWGGLWQANSSRYTVGHRLLMLLHPAGASGLTSPVNGMQGAIPVRVSGPGITATTPSVVSSTDVVDLRWVATRVSRPVVYRPTAPRSTVHASVALSQADRVALATSEIAASDASAASVPAQELSVISVMDMIQSWQEVTNAAR